MLPLPSLQRLTALLTYDPETGVFRWRQHMSSKARVGDQAGTVNASGHRHINIGGRHFYAHRLAWKFHYGSDPVGRLDHRDGIGDHNWISNIRPATHSQNMMNKGAHRGSKSGLKGVYPNGSGWIAIITSGGVRHYLGRFEDKIVAHEKYQEKARALHGEFARFS